MVVPAAEGQGHETNARLDQPTGQEGALSPLVARVAIPEPRVLPAQVERTASRLAEDHRECLLLESVQARAGEARVDTPANVFEGTEQAAAALQPPSVNPGRQ